MLAKSSQKKLIVITSITGLILGVTAPSYALNFSAQNFVDKVFEQFNSYFEVTKQNLSNHVAEVWGNLQKDAQAAIDQSLGDMGMADPTTASQNLENRLQAKGTAAERSGVVGATEAGKELERQTTRATVKSVLGKQGQQRTNAEMENTQQTVESGQQLGEVAQSMDASQNVLKAIAAQNSQIISMLGQQRVDGLQARHEQAQANLMLSHIAGETSSNNRRERLMHNAAVSKQMELIGWSRLDPAYTKK